MAAQVSCLVVAEMEQGPRDERKMKLPVGEPAGGATVVYPPQVPPLYHVPIVS